MLAEDKLREAQFFLKKMKHARKYVYFRYYQSAFMSAARSVTFVLQKDFRTKHGETFDQWYREQQTKIASNQTAALVTLCRNVALKEGNRLPLDTFRFPNPEHNGEYLDIKCDLGTQQKVTGFSYHFIDDKGRITLDNNRPVEEQIKEKMLEEFPKVSARIEDLVGRIFYDIKPEQFVSFHKDESPKPLKLWIKELDGYLTLLSEILSEAKSIFKS